ncbi:MAG: hypothetical protein SGJ09_00385 [Phycisphaerae bacterium]|nr:hypothetical protein [Phycisphaerae bacterium]
MRVTTSIQFAASQSARICGICGHVFSFDFPQHAAVAVKHRGAWLSIDDTDRRSKLACRRFRRNSGPSPQ